MPKKVDLREAPFISMPNSQLMFSSQHFHKHNFPLGFSMFLQKKTACSFAILNVDIASRGKWALANPGNNRHYSESLDSVSEIYSDGNDMNGFMVSSDGMLH